MKRRSFFQRVIGGFAAAVGFGKARTIRSGLDYRAWADLYLEPIRPTAPPNVEMVFIASGGRGYTLPSSPELDAALTARDAVKIGPTIYKQP